MSVGASYDPGVLSGLSWTQIADDLPHAVERGRPGSARHGQLRHRRDLRPDRRPAATACTPAVKALQAKI